MLHNSEKLRCQKVVTSKIVRYQLASWHYGSGIGLGDLCMYGAMMSTGHFHLMNVTFSITKDSKFIPFFFSLKLLIVLIIQMPRVQSRSSLFMSQTPMTQMTHSLSLTHSARAPPQLTHQQRNLVEMRSWSLQHWQYSFHIAYMLQKFRIWGHLKDETPYGMPRCGQLKSLANTPVKRII